MNFLANLEDIQHEIIWECFGEICHHRDEVTFITRNYQETSIKRSLLRFSSPLFNNILAGIPQRNQDILIHLPEVKKATLDMLFDLFRVGVTTGDVLDEDIEDIKKTAGLLGFSGLDCLVRVPASQVLTEEALNLVMPAEPIDYSMKVEESPYNVADLVIKTDTGEEDIEANTDHVYSVKEERTETDENSVDVEEKDFAANLLESSSDTRNQSDNTLISFLSNLPHSSPPSNHGTSLASAPSDHGTTAAPALPPTPEYSPPKEKEQKRESREEGGGGGARRVKRERTPVCKKRELQCLYHSSLCMNCGSRHRRIDGCSKDRNIYCKCRKAHSVFKSCSGSWLSPDKFEQAAIKLLKNEKNNKRTPVVKNVKKDHKVEDKRSNQKEKSKDSVRFNSNEAEERASKRRRSIERISQNRNCRDNSSSRRSSEGENYEKKRRVLLAKPEEKPVRPPMSSDEENYRKKRRALLAKPEPEAVGPPMSRLPELQYIYEYKYHSVCGRPHRRIDLCPQAPVHEPCGRRHSYAMDCSGTWMSLAKFESVAVRWPSSRIIADRLAKETLEKEERKRRRLAPEGMNSNCCLDWNFGICDEVNCKLRHRCSFIGYNRDLTPCLGRHKAREHREDHNYSNRK